jgi:PII-like signaling protein
MTPDKAEPPARTRLSGRALRLTVLIGEDDTWHRRPLYSEIVHRAHAAGLAGASVFRGIEGFGASSVVHTSRLLSLSEELPVAVVVVDGEERVRAFLPELADLVPEGLVTLDVCEVVDPAAPPAPHEEGKRSS